MAQTFDQYLAESGQQSKLDELRRTGQYDSARSAYESTGSFGGGGSSYSPGGGGGSFEDMARRALSLSREANQPAIQSLQASIPEIQKSFATQRQSLEAEKPRLQERYANLLSSLKGRETTESQNAQLATSRELGRRGITGSSGVADRALTEAVAPIMERFTGLTKDVGLQQEQDLANLVSQITGLTSQETSQTRAVQNAIAQLLSGDVGAAFSTAGQQAQLAQQANQFQQSQAADQAQRDLAKRMFEEIQLPESQANLRNIASQIANRGREAAGGSSELAALQAIFGGGTGGGFTMTPFPNVNKYLAAGDIEAARNLYYNP